MRKLLRVLGIVVGCVVVAVVVGRLGFGLYLDSGHAKRLASEQLSALFGGNVRVTDLEAGMGSTAVQLEVMAPSADGTAAPEPIVTGTVKANVSAGNESSLARRAVTLASLPLRYGARRFAPA